MSQHALIASVIFALAMIATVVIGLWSGRGREKSMTEWSVSSRGLGLIFVLILMSGETYTSFSFLGTAGWAYRYGVPILFLIGYVSSGFAAAYVVAPLIWTYCKRHDLVCISDIAEHRFRSRGLGILVTVLCTIFLVPYIQLQIQGMAVVVHAMSYNAIDLATASVVSFVVTEAFVLVSGLRGSAWVSVFKDGLVVVCIVFMAVYFPLHYFGGLREFVDRMIAEKAQWLTFPGHGTGEFGATWFVSTIVLNALTINIFPTMVSGFLSAKSPNSLRRNSIVLPWYQLLLIVPMMIGCMALFVVPALKDSDLALYRLVTDSLPSPIVAAVGVAGALSAIVPMSVFMLVIGTMWGRTVIGSKATGANKSAAQNVGQRRLAQLVCLCVGVVALAASLSVPELLVNLSVFSYEGMAQLVPIILLSLYWPRMSKEAGIAGLVAGAAVVILLHYTGEDPIWGINGGLIALAVNLVLVWVAVQLHPDPRAVANSASVAQRN
ncbi:MAG: sodium:solute symporter family protein [Rhodanobacteraceae bacterium]